MSKDTYSQEQTYFSYYLKTQCHSLSLVLSAHVELPFMIERVISYESSGSYLCVKTIHDPNPKKHLHDLSFVKLSFTDTCLDFLSIFDISCCKISSNPLELSKMLLKLMNLYKFTFCVYSCRYLTSWQLIFGRGLIFRIFNRLNLRFPFF